MTKSKKTSVIAPISILVLVLITLMTLTSCGNTNTAENEKVRIAMMTTGFVVPINYAIEEGYFAELGVDVSVEYFANGPAINEAIAAGDIDFAGIGQMPMITGSITNNNKLVGWVCDDQASIQGYARNDSDLVAAGQGALTEAPELLGTADTWRGKSILCAKGTSSHYALLATLNLFGLEESDIEFVNMDGASGAAAFAAGTGDIFFGFDPQWAAFYLDPDNFTQVSTCENAGRALGDVLVASNDFAANHGDTLTKVLQAVLKAQKAPASDPDLYAQAMYKWQTSYGSCTEELAAYSAEIKDLYTADGLLAIFDESKGDSVVTQSLLDVADFMIANNIITEEDKNTMIANQPVQTSYLFEAIKNLEN